MLAEFAGELILELTMRSVAQKASDTLSVEGLYVRATAFSEGNRRLLLLTGPRLAGFRGHLLACQPLVNADHGGT